MHTPEETSAADKRHSRGRSNNFVMAAESLNIHQENAGVDYLGSTEPTQGAHS
jgi:hypothetical protein